MAGSQRETAPGLTFFSQNLPRPVWGAAVIGVAFKCWFCYLFLSLTIFPFDMPAIMDKQK